MKSDKFKYIFVHIPKNAGSSIEHAMLSMEGIDASQGVNSLSSHLMKEFWVGGGNQHSTLDQYLSRGEYDNYFKFTVVRNPWDRMVSEYEYCRKGGDCRDLKCPYDFSEFCRKFTSGSLVGQGCANSEIYDTHLPCQNEFFGEEIDFICRYENLQKDFNIVCDRIGMPRYNLEVVNDTNRDRDYRKYYDDKTLELVSSFFSKDIFMFSYKFDPAVYEYVIV